MIDFCCIRCGYNTPYRHCIKRHLLKNKSCPSTKNNIDLTNEIVEHILKNRIYKKPQNVVKNTTTPKAINSHNKTINNTDNTTNSHNTINNTTIQYFITLDPIKKMEYHQEFICNTNPKSIEDLISEKYETQREDMLAGRGNYLYGFNDFVEMVSDVSKMKDINEFKDCVLIDKKGTNQTICFNESCTINPSWHSFDADTLTKFLVSKLQEQFLKNYECYLIRKIELPIEIFNENNDNNDNNETKEILINHINIYYKFISTFDLDSWAMESRSDSQILFNSDDDQYDSISSGTRLVYNYTQKYKKIVKETNSSELLKELKTEKRALFESLVRQNSINTHDKFDEKMRSDFVKNPKYMEKMQTRFDESINKST